MFTITNEIIFEQIINKSRFICYLNPVKSQEDINLILSTIRKKHYDATHNCYGYILGDEIVTAKNSDDGEPSGTAGIPIYEVLRKNNLTNVLAVVTRYYGGIKLGAGGLIRAYSSSVSKALELATFEKIEKLTNVKIEFDYEYMNIISNLMNNYEEISKSFNIKVEIEYLIPYNDKDTIVKELIDITKNNIKITL